MWPIARVAFCRVGRAAWQEFTKRRWQKQMGPALLPTPLSPSRGRFVSGIGSGEPSLLPSSLRAWLPVFHSRPAASCLVHPFGLSSFLAALLRGFSPVLAPASDLRFCIARFPFGPAPAFRPTPSLGSSPPLGESRDRYSELVSQTLMRLCPRAFVSQLSPAIISALNDCLASRLSQTIGLAFGRGLIACLFSRAAWTAATVSLFRKNLFEFSSLRFRFRRFSRLEDRSKLRPDRPFSKAGAGELSTFARIACGRGWTTQPLVAFT